MRVSRETCPLCECAWQIRLAANEMAVRCLRCGASAVTQSLADVVAQCCASLALLDVYELSATGPWVSYLRDRCASLTLSEYVDDVPPGTVIDGVFCQDVERLTFASSTFDLCTSTEVFEHVEDDRAGFGEIARVLRPGGLFVLTVPLHPFSDTIERTAVVDGRRVDVLPRNFHADRRRGACVLCHRDYGPDIVDRLQAAGFRDARTVLPARHLFGFARPVVVARKAT